jgi:hypothetical protein
MYRKNSNSGRPFINDYLKRYPWFFIEVHSSRELFGLSYAL